MALNPQLFPHNPMPVPFVGEVFVLARDGVEFEVDKIPLQAAGGHGGKIKAKGTIYLSNIRMVFVANKPVGGFFAFDMPLVTEAVASAMRRGKSPLGRLVSANFAEVFASTASPRLPPALLSPSAHPAPIPIGPVQASSHREKLLAVGSPPISRQRFLSVSG